jgi:hypothetical protein
MGSRIQRPDPDLEAIIAAMMAVTGSDTRAELLARLPLPVKQNMEALRCSGLDSGSEMDRLKLNAKLTQISAYLEADLKADLDPDKRRHGSRSFSQVT